MANILIGISGSIAALKSLTLIRALSQKSHKIKVILTKDAKVFITPTLITAFGIEVYDDELNFGNIEHSMMHIELAKFADMIIIAPATANTISKCANGFADNLLTQTILAYDGNYPILIAPAMNQNMWNKPIMKINIEKLNQQGFHIVTPIIGLQACGDYGIGCMENVDEILEIVSNILCHHHNGKQIIISLGATVEPIDQVRYISNHSSGKMGLSLIRKALDAGYKVIAICGRVDIQLPTIDGLTVINVSTVQEMLNSIINMASNADVFISCAAICDYRMENVSTEKIKKPNNVEFINIRLVKNPDVIARIAKQFSNLFCVGFAAETENLLENAKNKLRDKSLKMIVANNVSGGQIFGKNQTSIIVLNKDANILYSDDNITKDVAAKKIIQLITVELNNVNH